MRFTTIAFALVGFLTFADATFAQGTTSPVVGPNVPPAPVGHRQPRQSDISNNSQAGSTASSNAPTADPPAPAQSPEDARMNRILNGICRGC